MHGRTEDWMFQSRNWKRLAKCWKTSTSHSRGQDGHGRDRDRRNGRAQRAGVRVGNDDLAKVAATTPDRLIGVASVDPVEFGAEDQFLFGSSYPFRPMKQGVEDFQTVGLSEEAYAAATHLNASRLFGLAFHA